MLKVKELQERMELTALAVGSGDAEVSGCYIGDLMSLAMAKLEENNAWITIQSNINVVAVAVLKEAGCVILADGTLPDTDTVKKAEEENLSLFTTQKSAYETAIALGEIGI